MICSFFLGQMSVDREDRVDFNIMTRRNVRDLAHAFLPQGGEHVSLQLADSLKHLSSIYAI
jgi:hypothetical protein